MGAILSKGRCVKRYPDSLLLREPLSNRKSQDYVNEKKIQKCQAKIKHYLRRENHANKKQFITIYGNIYVYK